jgi:hypothetical protein
MKDKFIQIVTGQWKSESNGTINHTLYGLTVEGKVYKFMVNEGWVEIKMRPASKRRSPNEDEDPF